MKRILAGRWKAALLVALVGALGGRAGQAAEVLYDQDGVKFAVGLEAGLGAFVSNNVDFGAGNVNTSAPLAGPFASSQRRTDRQWFEGFLKPSAEGEVPLWDFGHGYGLVSLVGSMTRGNGDPSSSLAPQGSRSTTSDRPQHYTIEDLVLGWHSGTLFADSLGDDALDISAGDQSFVLGDAFLIGSGVVNGFSRAALYFGPRTAFDRTAIVKLNTSPVRAKLFQLETHTDQTLMHGLDQPKTKFVGADIELFKSGETASVGKAAGEKQATQASQATQSTRETEAVPDVWAAGVTFLRIYDADSTPETFSFPPGEASPTLSANGNRNGLNVYSGHLAGSFFEFDPDILLYSQFVLERNNDPNRRVDANAWYVEPGYKFSGLPWTPQLNLRYAHFSGDPNPSDRLKQSYDPLFTTGGDRGFGSWTQGEVFGQYLSANSNLNVAMVHLRASPLDSVEIGAIYYDFRFDQVRQFNDPRITSKHAADELDLYTIWSPTKWLTLTGVFGFAVPGAGFKQAAQAFVSDNGPPGRSVGHTMTVAEVFLSIQY